MGSYLLTEKLPMYDITKLLPQSQLKELLTLLPSPTNKRFGRPRCKQKYLLTGIIQVLVLGIGWNQIFNCGCSSSSCYRYFKELQRRSIYKQLFKKLSKTKTNITECASDTDTIKSYRFKAQVGWDGRHQVNGTKISLLSDIDGLPADTIIETAKTFDGNFIDRHMENTRRRRKKILNLDKIYVSLKRRREYRNKGTYVNMQTRSKDYIHKRGPKFQVKEEKYQVRFKIERTFAWVENFKRVKYRVDRYISSYRAFVYLALIIILIRN